MTGIVTPSTSLIQADQVTARLITVVLNGTTLPVLDAISGSVIFACTAGDTYSVTQVDTNSFGASVTSPPTAGVVPTLVIPPTAVPTTPGAPVVTFTDP